MTQQERLELLATAKAGHCALSLAIELGETDACAVITGSIKALVSALVALDNDKARALLRQIEIQHFVPADYQKPVRPYCAVSNYAEVVFR